MTGRLLLTAAQTRAAEAHAVASGTSLATLMARAGAAVADVVRRFGGGDEALVLCGTGNNGGDGYVAARLLREAGLPVRVASAGEPRTDLARDAAAGWAGAVEPLGDAVPAPILVDALFGTGLSRAIDPELGSALTRLASAARLRIAVDLPSGAASDDGRLLGETPAFHFTVALGVLKPAHRLLPAAASCGHVLLAGIGLVTAGDVRLFEIARPSLATPPYDATKYTRGKLLVVGGAMAGAGLLAATAAQRAGVGYVELLADAAGGHAPHALVRRDWSEHALADKRIGAIAIGPGLGLDDVARTRLEHALAVAKPTVLDADALTLIGKDRHERLAGHVVTPHWGEFVRLFGDDGRPRLDQARRAAAASGAVVLLKGADTIVAHPDGRAAINPLATGWLASAGTGDVLTGVIGALLAQGFDPFAAAQAGAWLHAEAGRAAGPMLIADDLVAELPRIVGLCL